MRSMLPVLVIAVLLTPACGWAEPPASASARKPVVGLPCEGCEEVFNGMPAAIGPSATIAPRGEPGEPMTIEGIVRNESGSPVGGVVVYAYQTDARGIYPGRDRTSHGTLRAWARSDAAGRYRFESIRPASYPGTTIPQHVHMHVVEPGRCTYSIDDILFDDDPNLVAAERARQRARGGNGIVVPRRDRGSWVVTRDIVLGRNIVGYPR